MKKIKRKIYIVGLNSFNFEDLSIDVQELFQKVKNIAVPNTYINEIRKWVSSKFIDEKHFFESKSNLDLINWLKFIDKDVILISRGDPLWYGIGRVLLNNFSKEELFFYPGKTSLQLAFSRLKKSWQDVKAVSIHGRETTELIKFLKLKEKGIDSNNVLTTYYCKSCTEFEMLRKLFHRLRMCNLLFQCFSNKRN